MSYKKEVRKMYKNIALQMGVKAPPLIIIGNSKSLNASDHNVIITINKSLAKLVYMDTDLVKCMIAHELTHSKNGDTKTRQKNLFKIFSKRVLAYSLVCEMRASIGGYTYIGMKSELSIMETEKKFKVPKLLADKKSAYRFGYPTSEQIAFFASQFDKMTVEIAKELLEDYCIVFNIKDKEKFIDHVIEVVKI
ncbi:hypothetical protein ACOMCU_24615 [Lysinibacillus sp. UGB7]|uniref:hypothetical protein n=1 Tax=Lysinibacillus sp. UGB7 TaxID=3411039 RepID=UPI003B82462B